MTLQSRTASGKQAMIQSANQAVGTSAEGVAASWYLTNADMESIHDDAEIAIGFNAVSSLITLTGGEVSKMLPDGDTPYHARVWEPGDRTNYEIVLVTDVTGDVLTVLRGREGTTAQTWTSAARIRVRNDVAVNYKAPINVASSETGAALSFLTVAHCDDSITIVSGREYTPDFSYSKLYVGCFSTSTGSLVWDGNYTDANYNYSSQIAKATSEYVAIGNNPVHILDITDGAEVSAIDLTTGLYTSVATSKAAEIVSDTFYCAMWYVPPKDPETVIIVQVDIPTGTRSDVLIDVGDLYLPGGVQKGIAAYFDGSAAVANYTMMSVDSSGYVDSGVDPFPWWPNGNLGGAYVVSGYALRGGAQEFMNNPTAQNTESFFYKDFEWDGNPIVAPGYPIGTYRIVKRAKADFSGDSIFESATRIYLGIDEIRHCTDSGLTCRDRSPSVGTYYTVSGDRAFSPYVARVDGSGDYSTRILPHWGSVASPDGDTISFITPDYDKVRNYVQEQNP